MATDQASAEEVATNTDLTQDAVQEEAFLLWAVIVHTVRYICQHDNPEDG
jgi:hypothetical protein